jgi:hypothetical protein
MAKKRRKYFTKRKKHTIGTGTGAVIGAVAGASTGVPLAIIGGTYAGAKIGQKMAKESTGSYKKPRKENVFRKIIPF